MAAFINTNIASLNAQRNLSSSQTGLNSALQRLSSGLRINSAKDDAAGLAISERMTSQIRGLSQAARNANDGISLAQTAEGALGEISNNLQRIRELAVQSANATNNASDRASLNAEAQQLVAEIDRVAQTTAFNGKKVLDGSFVSQLFQVGADANQTISVSTSNARTSSLGAYASVSTAANSDQRSLLSADLTTGAAIGDANNLNADELTVNGVAIAAPTADGVSYNPVAGQSAQSAIAIANAINGSTAGVTARADANTVNLGTVTAGTLASGGFAINNVSIVGAFAGGASTDIVTAINAVTNQTGVTAALNDSSQLVLTASDGRNITLSQDTDATNAADIFQSADGATLDLTGTVDVVFESTDATASTATIRSTVTLTDDTAITVGNGVAGGNASEIGFTTGTTATSSATALASLSLATADLAQAAMATIDTALATVNDQRASLGAYQNRFTSAIASLQASTENLSASRSRIQDADFAAETASLTRGQILQQAGTAMLAQANSLPNGVLALLRG